MLRRPCHEGIAAPACSPGCDAPGGRHLLRAGAELRPPPGRSAWLIPAMPCSIPGSGLTVHALTTPEVNVWDADLLPGEEHLRLFRNDVRQPLAHGAGDSHRQPTLAFNVLVLGLFVLGLYCTFLLVRSLTGSFVASLRASSFPLIPIAGRKSCTCSYCRSSGHRSPCCWPIGSWRRSGRAPWQACSRPLCSITRRLPRHDPHDYDDRLRRRPPAGGTQGQGPFRLPHRPAPFAPPSWRGACSPLSRSVLAPVPTCGRHGTGTSSAARPTTPLFRAKFLAILCRTGASGRTRGCMRGWRGGFAATAGWASSRGCSPWAECSSPVSKRPRGRTLFRLDGPGDGSAHAGTVPDPVQRAASLSAAVLPVYHLVPGGKVIRACRPVSFSRCCCV